MSSELFYNSLIKIDKLLDKLKKHQQCKTHFFILNNLGNGFCSAFSVILSYKVACINTKYEVLPMTYNKWPIFKHLFDLPILEPNYSTEIINASHHITENFILKYNLSQYSYHYNNFRIKKNNDTLIYLWCSPKFYYDNNLQKIRNDFNIAFNTFKIKNFILEKVNSEINLIGNINSALAVFIRSTAHYSKINFNIMMNGIIKELILLLEKYEKIIIFTQVIEVVDLLKKTEIQHKLYFKNQNNMYSNYNNGDWCNYKNINEVFIKQEFEDCLIDLLIASKCKCVMGGVSNMMFTVLLMNPDIEFKLFDVLQNIKGM